MQHRLSEPLPTLPGRLFFVVYNNSMDEFLSELLEALADPTINSDLVEVDGYVREDGTEVDSYLRTMPDSDVTNNLSFWDLVNEA